LNRHPYFLVVIMNERHSQGKKRQLSSKQEFYQHLSVYLVMSVFFLLLNLATSIGTLWFHWPVMAWGLAVAFHYIDVFGFFGQARDHEPERALPEARGEKDTLLDDEEEELPLRPLEKAPRKWDESDLV
jgi:carbohydrate-selective porin OprB